MPSIRSAHLAWTVALVATAAALTLGLRTQFAVADGVPTIDSEGLVYSGQLTKGGQPLTGKVDLEGRLYNTKNVGTKVPLCIQPAQPDLSDGRFTIAFTDPACVEAIHANKDLWVVINVAGAALPPAKVSAVPFAHEAERANGLTLLAAKALLAAVTTPPGSVMAFAGDKAPAGWLFCDGKEYSQSDAATKPLFDAIGTSHGNANGKIGFFNVPDYQGRFLRGVGPKSTENPDADQRGPMNKGGNDGDKVGSLQFGATKLPTLGFQADSAGDHAHLLNPDIAINTLAGKGQLYNGGTYGNTLSNITNGGNQTGNKGAHTHTVSGGDSETRPVNAAVNWIIKL